MLRREFAFQNNCRTCSTIASQHFSISAKVPRRDFAFQNRWWFFYTIASQHFPFSAKVLRRDFAFQNRCWTFFYDRVSALLMFSKSAETRFCFWILTLPAHMHCPGWWHRLKTAILPRAPQAKRKASNATNPRSKWTCACRWSHSKKNKGFV